MTGIPCHTSEYYLFKLVKLGESIIIFNQIKNEYYKNKLIYRKVVHVITFGTITKEVFLK